MPCRSTSDLRRLLRAELGIEPTPATSRPARHGAATGPAHLDSDGARCVLRPGRGRRRSARLPAPVGPLIGRRTELACDSRRIGGRPPADHHHRPRRGGQEQAARRNRDAATSQTKPLLYTELAGLGRAGPAEVAEAIAVGQLPIDGRRPPLESLIRRPRRRPWLLLIDEAEWVIEALAPVLTSILEACPQVQIVVTSRIPLEVSGESLVLLEPLACPAPGADAGIDPGSSGGAIPGPTAGRPRASLSARTARPPTCWPPSPGRSTDSPSPSNWRRVRRLDGA